MPEEKYPQFIKVDRSIKEKYLKPLVEDDSSMFYKQHLGDIYFLACALGFRNGARIKTDQREDLRLYSTTQDRFKLLIRLIALSSSNFEYEVLSDGNNVLKTVEEYVNGGAPILFDMIFGKGLDFSIEDEIWNMVK